MLCNLTKLDTFITELLKAFLESQKSDAENAATKNATAAYANFVIEFPWRRFRLLPCQTTSQERAPSSM
ncbi:hypothetical protein HUJ04_004692 [Dendroctonus ponderosae]|nr:hypothetical protein HUJ04_004692 [Dendroctonus ponderosae]